MNQNQPAVRFSAGASSARHRAHRGVPCGDGPPASAATAGALPGKTFAGANKVVRGSLFTMVLREGKRNANIFWVALL